MVQIKIKGRNEAYHIYAQYDDASAFFQQLKERLKFCQNKNGQYFEAFFHIEGLKPQHLKPLFQLCADCHTLIAGINELPQVKPRRILEQELRGGEHYRFHEPLLLLGNIRKQAFVTSSESLYVLGSVQGSVDLLHEDCVLAASHMDGNVRICDTHFQNMTSFAPCKVYYENIHLEMKEYKEERMWERQ